MLYRFIEFDFKIGWKTLIIVGKLYAISSAVEKKMSILIGINKLFLDLIK